MNKQTLILILALILFFIPTGIVVHAFTVDKYKILEGEGVCAYSIAFLSLDDKPITPIPLPKPDVKECKCNGTKKVRTGDGLASIKCPCGDSCKCQSPKGLPTNRIVLLTAPRRCKPCKQLDETTIPALKVVGWTFGRNKNIEVVDLDENPNSGYTAESIPCFVTLDGNGKELRRYEGYVNAGAMGRVYRGEELLKGDDIIVEYKIKKK